MGDYLYEDWREVEIASWRALMSHVIDHVESGSRFVYRGQADRTWDLSPSLLRVVAKDTSAEAILKLEQECLREFQAQAHLYIGADHLPARGETPMSWWSLMQHHGAPTRLLDWTRSPLVAAYFAVEQEPDLPGAVFVIDSSAVTAALHARYSNAVDDDAARPFEVVHGNLFKPSAPDDLLFWSQPLRRTARSVAQQGLVSVSANVANRCEGLRNICVEHSGVRSHLEAARRWIFPPKVKPEILRHLRVANITAQTLFPGLDGLGRSVREVAAIGQSLTQTLGGAHLPSTTRIMPPSVDGDSR